VVVVEEVGRPRGLRGRAWQQQVRKFHFGWSHGRIGSSELILARIWSRRTRTSDDPSHPDGHHQRRPAPTTDRPVRLVVAPMSSTTTWWLVSGRPRQLLVIAENNRCSILFHFEVPGG
jgi:hypothetical protein